MASAPPPTTTKPSSNIPGIFLRFSKLCKLKSVGVSSSTEKPNSDPCFKSTEADCSEDKSDYKVHPQPIEDTYLTASIDGLEEAVISRLFAAISALKLAYIQLQQGHIPYDPKKIRLADELVVSELESLTELEHLYMEKLRSKPESKPSLIVEIQRQNSLLEELQANVQEKDSEILRLKWEIEESDMRNVELEEELDRKVSPVEKIFSVSRELTPSVFHEVFKLTYKSIHVFAKPLINMMKASGWDLNRAASSITGSITYVEKSHKKFAFEACLSRAMLSGCGDEQLEFDHFDHIMSHRDPFDALLEGLDSSFGRFCQSKYLMVVPSKMESLFFGNLDQRQFVLSGGHPRTPFYQAFVRMARWVWALQVIACSFIPKAEIFYVKRGDEYSKEYMESIVNPVIHEGEKLQVGLTVMPGFRSQGNVIRCRVYLCKVKPFIGAR